MFCALPRAVRTFWHKNHRDPNRYPWYLAILLASWSCCHNRAGWFKISLIKVNSLTLIPEKKTFGKQPKSTPIAVKMFILRKEVPMYVWGWFLFEIISSKGKVFIAYVRQHDGLLHGKLYWGESSSSTQWKYFILKYILTLYYTEMITRNLSSLLTCCMAIWVIILCGLSSFSSLRSHI